MSLAEEAIIQEGPRLDKLGRPIPRKVVDEAFMSQVLDLVSDATYWQARKAYKAFLHDPAVIGNPWYVAQLGLYDRFFFLTSILARKDALHPWLYERLRELDENPDGYLDLWAREHFKSSAITFAGSLQEIARNPEITIGIFSHTRAIAKSFVGWIKRECEVNTALNYYYPEAFWANPAKESPSWSLDAGLVMRRQGNPKEATVEAGGIVDSQPVSKHFSLMIYDDVVTRDSVATPDQITKTTEAWELSRHLSAKNLYSGDRPPRTWYVGTRYHFADTYHVIISRGAATPRVYPATDNGLPDGKPVLLSQAEWNRKKKESSAATIACQMLLNPLAGGEQEFQAEWVRRWEVRPETLNVAICVDPASSRKKASCNTAMAVIGIDAGHNKYLLDGACHRMTLSERWEMLKYLRQKWVRLPGIQAVMVAYERYGMQADIEHFKEMMIVQKCPFPITEVSWVRDGEQAKDDRIRRLIPDHQNWRFYYPYEGPETSIQARAIARGRDYLKSGPIKRKNEEGKVYNLVDWFLSNEYLFFPATTHKDMLDAMSRFYDLPINPPQALKESQVLPEFDGDY